MRLWHYKLIPHLPRQQLLGQHRECCALRGKGWGKKHSTVDYVFNYTKDKLVAYHWQIIDGMEERGYKVCPDWKTLGYEGKLLPYNRDIKMELYYHTWQYPEHDDDYLEECLLNLEGKGIYLRDKLESEVK